MISIEYNSIDNICRPLAPSLGQRLALQEIEILNLHRPNGSEKTKITSDTTQWKPTESNSKEWQDAFLSVGRKN
ncbi:hypothetical protein CEXT_277481 [Caerostris extrusa]|uniref:Uncharacterized protein n=1 Tax=Caerostris extrusa TaxID=172846 RepID=A0AAV4XXA3_CAEEX|nr:hypothetical protein CEXT_277481 [Caerostris extrusa]